MRRIGALAWMSVLLVACSNSNDDFAAPEYPNAPVETIVIGDGWSVELVRPSEGESCWWIRVGTDTTSCMSLEYSDGSFAQQTISGPQRTFVVFIAGDDEPAVFTWFSSLDDGRVIESVPVEGIRLAVVALADGEEPWGMQLLDADGVLTQVWSLVDQR